MSHRIVASASALVLAVCTAVFVVQGASAVGTEKCPEGGYKIEAGPWEHCVKDGVIKSVCVKAGNQTYEFVDDGENGCYEVKGIGTPCVHVDQKGKGRTCKDISNVVFYFDKKD